eukprot:6189341-Pleurochrysis_carterae.AAC.3
MVRDAALCIVQAMRCGCAMYEKADTVFRMVFSWNRVQGHANFCLREPLRLGASAYVYVGFQCDARAHQHARARPWQC